METQAFFTDEDIYLCFDTETTGIVKRGVDLGDPSQPHVLQLAAVLTDAKGNELEEMCVLIKPDNWQPDADGNIIHPKALEVHGITLERCADEGISIIEALEQFNAMKAKCTKRIGFNVSFDKQMLASVAIRAGVPHESIQPSICIMKAAGAIMKMSPTDNMIKSGRGAGNKPPKLSEAYQYFMGKPFEKGHDALIDVRGTNDVFRKIRELHGDGAFVERDAWNAEKSRQPVERAEPIAAGEPAAIERKLSAF